MYRWYCYEDEHHFSATSHITLLSKMPTPISYLRKLFRVYMVHERNLR